MRLALHWAFIAGLCVLLAIYLVLVDATLIWVMAWSGAFLIGSALIHGAQWSYSEDELKDDMAPPNRPNDQAWSDGE